MPRAAQTKYWIGPSGWSYPDWERVVYPVRKPRGFKPLSYIARYVNAVEVNTSFYRIPSPRMTAAWVPLVPPEFRFAFKLTQTFTHKRDAFPPQSDFDAFGEALRPIGEAGLLGPVLMQFPWSFRFNSQNAEWIGRLSERLTDFERVVEVRHSSWHCPEGLDAVRKAGGFCNIDQPRLRDCLGPTEHVSRTERGASAYVRLHGRNAASWFADNIPGYERYNYTYTDEEIREWIGRIERMSGEADQVYIFANNHYRGQGVANALEIRALLEGGRVEVPPALLDEYSRLAAIALPSREPGLFDSR